MMICSPSEPSVLSRRSIPTIMPKATVWSHTLPGVKYAREVSLFEPIGTDKEGNEINLIDIISQDEATILDSMVHAYHINRLPYCLKHCLSEQEASLIIRRYGLYGHPPRTQKEIASQMGISRSYVSRIEKRALQKIRRQLEA